MVETEAAATEGRTGQPAQRARQQRRQTMKYHVFAELMEIYIRYKFTCR